MLICFSALPLWASDSLCTNTDILPVMFFKNDRYSYYEDKIYLDYQIEANSNLKQVPLVLLSGVSSRQQTFFLMLDVNFVSHEISVFWSRDMQVRKKQVVAENDDAFLKNRLLNVSLELDMKKDQVRCSILPGDTLDFNPAGLSVDDGYKFGLHLPYASDRGGRGKQEDVALRSLKITSFQEPAKSNIIYWYIFIGVIDVVIFVFMFCRHRRKRKKESPEFDIQAVTSTCVNRPALPQKSAIYLFGGLRVFNKEGEDIAKRFSPILKELLSLLIVHSDKKGISAEKMKAYLWQDKSIASARNNRAVNLGKLRNLLADVGNFEIKSDDGYWRIDTDDAFIDYLTCRTVLRNPGVATRSEIELLCSLTQEGTVLPEQNYEWLDSLRGLISDDLFDKFLAFADSPDEKEASDIYILIADVMFAFESINEQALSLKCRAYYKSGRHSAAKIFYDKFCEEYRSVYGEDFHVSFPEVLKSNVQCVF